MDIYLEIMIPYCTIGREGIKLPTGFMHRTREGVETKFFSSLAPRDDVVDRDGNLIPGVIASLISEHKTSGMSITVYDDLTDSYKQLVRMKLGDLDDLEFEMNKAYVFE